MTGCSKRYRSGFWPAETGSGYLLIPGILLFTLLLQGPPLLAQPAPILQVSVREVTPEAVYLAGGSEQGLQVGDRLVIRRNGQFAVLLEVLQTASHSAICKIVEQKQPIQPGDVAIRVESAATRSKVQTRKDSTQATERRAASEKERPRSAPPVRMSAVYRPGNLTGNLSFQLYGLNDLTESNLDFLQPTLRLNLRWRNLWGKGYQLEVRSRFRYNQRDRAFAGRIPGSEWRNRVYLFAFGRTGPAYPFRFQVGRILPTQLSGVGYLDGLLVERHLFSGWSVGLLAGSRPQWQFARFQTSMQKYAWYVHLQWLRRARLSGQSTLAISGEYHGRTVSREFLYWQHQFRSKRWQAYLSSEVEINRQWRWLQTRKRLALSNLFLLVSYRFSPQARLNVSYDTRQNYWTYETRTLEDSLFDDLFRRGLRARLALRPAGSFFVNVDFGVRHRQGEGRSTYSSGLRLAYAPGGSGGLRISLQASGFSGGYSRGLLWGARVSKYLLGGQRIGAGFRSYQYEFTTTNLTRTNQSVQLEWEWNLAYRIFWLGSYEYGLSGDLKSHRFLVELGYRL